jgi:hypothetical protein
MNWLNSAADGFKLIPPIVASITLFAIGRGWWLRTLGRRKAWEKNFRKLAPGVLDDYVKDLFSQPAFAYPVKAQGTVAGPLGSLSSDKSTVELTVRVWLLARNGFLMTWSVKEHEVILAYSLTTISRWFHPRIRIGLPGSSIEHHISLGRTRFSHLPDPDWYYGWRGARRYGYMESHYFGDLGGGQTWYCGLNQLGYRDLRELPFNVEGEGRPGEELARFRSHARIDSVIIAHFGDLQLPLRSTGPELTQVQLLNPQQWRDRWRTWRQGRRFARQWEEVAKEQDK